MNSIEIKDRMDNEMKLIDQTSTESIREAKRIRRECSNYFQYQYKKEI